MPYTVMGGELDCSHAEELCKKLIETKGCWHTVIGTGQLKQDGSPAAWNCVMCGTSFAPKMSEKSLADLYQIGFSNGRKSAEILSPKKHPQPAQQEPVAAECNFVGTKEWGRCSIEHHNLVQSEPHNWPGYQTRLLYTSPQPPQRKPLTLGQKQRLWSSVGDKPTLKDRVNAYGLAIEAAHGIKENT